MIRNITVIDGYNLRVTDKAMDIKKLVEGSRIIDPPTRFVPDLVCVVNVDMFDSALYVQSKNEMRELLNPLDTRPKTWMLVPNAEYYAD